LRRFSGGLARRARATLGVTAWDASNAFDPDQEELYIPLSGSGTLVAGEDRFDLVPGTMAE
jgi:hypothetical protein